MTPNFERAAQLLQITLRFTRPVHLHFFHHPAMYAAIMDRLGNPEGVWLYCPERGRVHYRPGEPYRFGIALTPGAALSTGRIVRLLKSPPVTAFGKAQGAPFGDNFRVEQVLDVVTGSSLRGDAAWLDMASLQSIATALSKEKAITLAWLSPLLIHRTPLNSRQFVMDGEVFEPQKLMDRVARTVRECWPDVSIPESADVRVVENHMIRADVSYPKKRLLGASGSVRLEFGNAVGDWALPLLLSGPVGVGKARNMGQGRFSVDKFPVHPCWPPMPAKTILECAAAPENLERARTAMQDPFVSKEEATEMRRFRSAISPPSPERRPVYVVSRDAALTGRKRGLYVEQEGEAPRLVGWRETSEIVVMGRRYIKSMLNLLYTHLFRATHTTILSVGLDPYLGVMHEGRGRYAALAADMMEPFRFLADRVVIGAVNRGRITRDDFQKNEKGPYKIRTLSEPLKLLIKEFETQLAREVSDAGGRKDSFRGHLYRQVLSMGRLVDGREDRFFAFRMKCGDRGLADARSQRDV